MSRTALVFFSLAALVALAPADAGAEADAPGDQAARIVSSGQGPAGEHAFLAFTPTGPKVFVGKVGHLVQLHVMDVSPNGASYSVGTEEMGRMVFHTADQRVVVPGDMGFLARRPGRVFDQRANADARAEVAKLIAVASGAAAHPTNLPSTKKYSSRQGYRHHNAARRRTGGRELVDHPTVGRRGALKARVRSH